MSIAAGQAGDTLSILGQNGIITSELSNPDKVLIDVDLATLPGLQINVSDELLMYVDGSTIEINGSDQLAVMAGVIDTLNDLSDVTVSTPLNDEALAYDGVAGEWQNEAAALSGSTGAATGSTSVLTALGTTGGTGVINNHNHGENTTDAAASDHTHFFDPLQKNTGGPSSTTSVVTNTGNASGGTTVVSSVSVATTENTYDNNHTHASSDLGISFS